MFQVDNCAQPACITKDLCMIFYARDARISASRYDKINKRNYIPQLKSEILSFIFYYILAELRNGLSKTVLTIIACGIRWFHAYFNSQNVEKLNAFYLNFT